MVLVDTSVLIGYFRGIEDEKIHLFAEILRCNIPFGISPYTYQELLQGSKNESEFATLREYLSTQTLHTLPEGLETFERAARIYFELRRKGITVRSSIDVLIALTAIENNVALLHNDRDFDQMEGNIEGLRILRKL